jgi:divalent metal cation (Fe/Co/Zn/Cd) transporter
VDAELAGQGGLRHQSAARYRDSGTAWTPAIHNMANPASIRREWHCQEQLRPTYPEVPRDVWVAYTVLFISIGLEAFSFRTAVREANKSRGSKSIPRYVRDSRQPELPVVLLEDFGALIGLGFALAGIFLASGTGDGRWDGMGAVAIGTLLVVIAVFLSYKMASMLIGESALPEENARVLAALTEQVGIESVIHMRTLHTGPDEFLVAAKVAVDPDETAARVADIVDLAEQRIRKDVPGARWIYIEADIRRPEGFAGDAPDPAVEDPGAWSHIVPVDEPPAQGDATGR